MRVRQGGDNERVRVRSFYHYRIDRLENGNVILNGSRAQEKFPLTSNDVTVNVPQRLASVSDQFEFPGPMELIGHFQRNADALITTLSIPCQRPFVSVGIALVAMNLLVYVCSQGHNFVQYWCAPLLTPELYMNKICQEASNTDPEVTKEPDLTDRCALARFVRLSRFPSRRN